MTDTINRDAEILKLRKAIERVLEVDEPPDYGEKLKAWHAMQDALTTPAPELREILEKMVGALLQVHSTLNTFVIDQNGVNALLAIGKASSVIRDTLSQIREPLSRLGVGV